MPFWVNYHLARMSEAPKKYPDLTTFLQTLTSSSLFCKRSKDAAVRRPVTSCPVRMPSWNNRHKLLLSVEAQITNAISLCVRVVNDQAFDRSSTSIIRYLWWS